MCVYYNECDVLRIWWLVHKHPNETTCFTKEEKQTKPKPTEQVANPRDYVSVFSKCTINTNHQQSAHKPLVCFIDRVVQIFFWQKGLLPEVCVQMFEQIDKQRDEKIHHSFNCIANTQYMSYKLFILVCFILVVFARLIYLHIRDHIYVSIQKSLHLIAMRSTRWSTWVRKEESRAS